MRLPLAALAAFLLPVTAAAQQPMFCVPRDALVQALMKSHNEAPYGRGVGQQGQMLEIFVSPGGETWTASIANPNGTSCVVASGQGWQDVERAEPKKGEPS